MSDFDNKPEDDPFKASNDNQDNDDNSEDFNPFSKDGQDELRGLLREAIRLFGETSDSVIGGGRYVIETATPHLKNAKSELQKAFEIAKPELENTKKALEENAKKAEKLAKQGQDKIQAVLRRFGLDK